MYIISGSISEKIEAISFSELDITENQIEELLRKNIEMICDEEESMLVVGQQVRNASNGRSDLTAVDDKGNIVLIEIKRDRKDIENRKEAFEFQAIRYAASYATIADTEDLVNKIFAPYVEKHRLEFDNPSLTSSELGTRILNNFLEVNTAVDQFNKKQKIVLVASDFDEQTLSAVAWLNDSGVDISCFKLIPYRIQGSIVLNVAKILPLNEYTDYYVNFLDKSSSTKKQKTGLTKRVLPKIDAMLEWGVVKPGDTIRAKDRSETAILLDNGLVETNGEIASMQKWLKGLYGWSSIQTYVFAVHEETGKTLAEIRQTYMDEQSQKEI
ncbi:hypothetical protein QMA09_15780 [Planococcus sp. APC 3906]|uniref:hypothetical protein n=1 Tax=Planococcus sp. APC 3906 TaxID=3035194 RepID=UPI0025B3C890|nr:hypothetical protein [Planococcus sp. APC 3906]MDN3451659.1 hypothetical protein [Planococcus sp. APC 3906]